jgi:hypothetical protein
MIVLDEQLLSYGIQASIARWYRGAVTDITQLRPNTVILDEAIPMKEGLGQVVLLSGEAGIGKSFLVQVLKEYVVTEPQACLRSRQCSPYD